MNWKTVEFGKPVKRFLFSFSDLKPVSKSDRLRREETAQRGIVLPDEGDRRILFQKE